MFQISGVILNSLSSIISYNSYDYSCLLGNKVKQHRSGHANHQQSFIRQCIYTGLITAFYLCFTISSLLIIGNSTQLAVTDTVGFTHKVPATFFYNILYISWGCHAVACILTACYYNSHPSSVNMDPSMKTELWILGEKKNIICKVKT